MKLFRLNGSEDERIRNIVNKFLKEAYFLAVIIALLSICIKYYLYKVDSDLVITELAVIIIPTVYYWIRMISSGIYSDSIEVHDRVSRLSMSKKNIIFGLTIGLVLSMYIGLQSSIIYGNGDNSIYYFLIIFLVSIMIYIPFFVSIIFISDLISRKVSSRDAPDDGDNE